MSSEPECEKIRVVIASNWGWGDIPNISLEDWIAKGPGSRWHIGPAGAICADDGRRLPISVIPLQYRNNEFAQFLYAAGAVPYPWNHGSSIVHPPALEFLPADEPLRYLGGKTSRISQDKSGSLDLQSDEITLQFPANWYVYPVKVYGDGGNLFSNCEINDRVLKPLSSERDFIGIFNVRFGGFVEFSPIIEHYIPTGGLVPGWEQHNTTINNHEVAYIITEPDAENRAFLAFVYKVKHIVPVVMHWLQYFAVVKNEHKASLLQEIFAMLSTIRLSAE